ncbi:MAG: response regulator transcription factor [Lachnospiraceae bacterium]|nr:response regulator transcription factor [Lachnospiraceae bacterium]MDD3796517.1 response regulator transcription factor [Lachnospiraceae bacterium]
MRENLILIIEDEEKLLFTLRDYLRMNGYRVLTACDGNSGLEIFYDHMHEIDLLLLDIMMPGINGSEVLKEVRKQSDLPVIMMTAKESIESQLTSFEQGADDYIIKPYVLAVVKVHIEAILRRAGKISEQVTAGVVLVDSGAGKVYIDGEDIEATRKEFELMVFLVQNQNLVLKREKILNSVWGYEYSGNQRTVDTLIKQLRKKMGKYGTYIRSIYGAGYVFEVNTDETA